MVLQARPHQHRTDGQERLTQTACHASFLEAKDTVDCMGSEGVLLAYVQLAIHKYSQVFSDRALLNLFIPQLVLVEEVASLNLMRFS